MEQPARETNISVVFRERENDPRDFPRLSERNALFFHRSRSRIERIVAATVSILFTKLRFFPVKHPRLAFE